jgi:hypothetical protein
MAAMTLTSALRAAHVRSASDYGSTSHRACPCCVSMVPRSKDAARARRAQRRRENNALRAGREDY